MLLPVHNQDLNLNSEPLRIWAQVIIQVQLPVLNSSTHISTVEMIMTAPQRRYDNFCPSPMSTAAHSFHSPMGLSCNNELAFHSDGAALGLRAQRVIKGLVTLISSDPPRMAADGIQYQHRDLHLCRCILAAVAAGHQGPCHFRESHGTRWTVFSESSLDKRTSWEIIREQYKKNMKGKCEDTHTQTSYHKNQYININYGGTDGSTN